MSEKTRRRTVVAAIILAVVAAVAVALYFILRPQPAPPAMPVVDVQKVRQADVNVYGEYVGRSSSKSVPVSRATSSKCSSRRAPI